MNNLLVSIRQLLISILGISFYDDVVFVLHALLDLIILIIILICVIFVVGLIIDAFYNYNREKIAAKLIPRTGKKDTGGGEELFGRYWVWQRKKRKLIISELLQQNSSSNRYYPRSKWGKKGSVKFPFRRECWVILK